MATRIGAKHLFGLGVLCTSVLTLFTPLAARHSVSALVALRVLEGLGEVIFLDAPAMEGLGEVIFLDAPAMEVLGEVIFLDAPAMEGLGEVIFLDAPVMEGLGEVIFLGAPAMLLNIDYIRVPHYLELSRVSRNS